MSTLQVNRASLGNAPAEPDPARAGAKTRPSMDLRLVEWFVVAAEELHLGRAAERLATGRPALSRAIQLLERQLGVELLKRDGHSLQLTAAGEAMLEGSRDLLERHEGLAEEVVRASRVERGAVAICADDGFSGLLLAKAVREYRELATGTEVRLLSSPYGASAEQVLLDGTVDFALVGVPPSDLRIRAAAVAACRRMVVLPRGHRLAERGKVALEALRGEAELRGRGGAKWCKEWSIAGLLGESPSWGGQFDMLPEALDLVAAGCGLALAPDLAAARLDREDLHWVAIDGLDPVPVHLAWRRRSVSRHRAELLSGAFGAAV